MKPVPAEAAGMVAVASAGPVGRPPETAYRPAVTSDWPVVPAFLRMATLTSPRVGASEAWSTVPAVAEAMLSTKEGSSTFTGRLVGELKFTWTRLPDSGAMVTSRVWPPPICTRRHTALLPESSQLCGMPRPMTRVPSFWTTTEVSGSVLRMPLEPQDSRSAGGVVHEPFL
ncbi:hypothetical protein [Streptomyces sp. NPDC021020]|uniref:hypothetical protein n=1 Tax=Streptomyces sp. NPDC021020 TaxID=3365109 RepID=UPI00378B2999